MNVKYIFMAAALSAAACTTSDEFGAPQRAGGELVVEAQLVRTSEWKSRAAGAEQSGAGAEYGAANVEYSASGVSAGAENVEYSDPIESSDGLFVLSATRQEWTADPNDPGAFNPNNAAAPNNPAAPGNAGSPAPGTPITRGTPITSSSGIKEMRVNIFQTGTANWTTSATRTAAITATRSGSGFTTSPVYNWPVDATAKTTLFAYSPLATSANGLTDNGANTITYIVPTTVANQPDLCTAAPKMDVVNSDGTQQIQSFALSHQLTAVGFSMLGWNVKITKITISGVAVTGTLTMNTSGGASWSTSTTGSREVGITQNSFSHNHDSNYDNITNSNGYLMMIPQTFTDAATVTITYVSTGTGSEGGTASAKLKDLGVTWTAGDKITYNIRLKTAPAVTSGDMTITTHKSGYTTSSPLTMYTDKDDKVTFKWAESWLKIHIGSPINGNPTSSNGRPGPWTVTGPISNIYFFTTDDNTSSGPRTAIITATGTRSGTKTFTVTQAKAPAGNDYTGKPANCYITQPGKPLLFNATLKPRIKNGSISSQTTCTDVRSSQEGLNKDIPLSSIKRVEVSWQTAANHSTTGGAANMIIQKIEYNATTGVCTVTPHATGTGNAVISAYDAASGGKILWNWHIWVTNGTVGNAGTANGFTFMDRNLGALAATAAKPAKADAYKYFGVIYQHGRPTPFSGQGAGETVNTYTARYNGAATKLSSGSIGGYTQSNTAVSSVTSAIQNPNTYYYSGNSWYNFADTSLWSDYGTNKSIYDPCPYGYRVPKNGSWAGFSATSWTANTIEGGTVWSNTWWPAAGRRTTASGALETVGYYGWYWSSSRYSLAYYSYCLYFNYNGRVFPSNADNRSYGFPVRCVQE